MSATLTDWASLATVLGFILGSAVFWYSIHTFKKTIRQSNYYALDQMYADLLKLGIERPHLRMREPDRTPQEQQEYECYAHLVWCFVESVYDHSRVMNDLLGTWMSAIQIEKKMHGRWLERPAARDMFNPEFLDYIASIKLTH